MKVSTAEGSCIGCAYQNGRAECQEIGPVILASGVFVADLTSDSLLAQFPAAVFHAPPTNGEPCTANGIKMGEASGAKRINLEWVHDLPSALCGRLSATFLMLTCNCVELRSRSAWWRVLKLSA